VRKIAYVIRVPHNASVISSTRLTLTPARYISTSASSTELSRPCDSTLLGEQTYKLAPCRSIYCSSGQVTLSILKTGLGDNRNREFVKRFHAKLPAFLLQPITLSQVIWLRGVPDFGSGENLNHRPAHVKNGCRLSRFKQAM